MNSKESNSVMGRWSWMDAMGLGSHHRFHQDTWWNNSTSRSLAVFPQLVFRRWDMSPRDNRFLVVDSMEIASSLSWFAISRLSMMLCLILLWTRCLRSPFVTTAVRLLQLMEYL